MRSLLAAVRRPAVLVTLSLVLCVLFVGHEVDGYSASAYVDLRVYRAGAAEWLAGRSAYAGPLTPEGLLFTYPPFALLALAPLALVPFAAASVLLVGADLAALWLVLLLAARVARPDLTDRGPALDAVVLLGPALWLEPFRTTFDYGQVNVLLLALVVLDALAVPARARGVLTGLAAAAKLVPLVLVVYYAATRQWRAAGTLVLTFLAATGLAALVAPADSRAYWVRHLGDTARIGDVWGATNSSLRGVLARLADGGSWAAPCWLVASAAVAALGYAAIARAQAYGARLTALATGGLLGVLLSPISWTHHWVWLPLLVLALLTEAASREARVLAGVAALAGYVAPMWLVPGSEEVEFGWSPVEHVIGATYVLVALAAVLLALRGRFRQRSEPAPSPHPATVARALP